MAKNKCHGCIKLEEHIKLAREIKRHSEEVNALKYQMSDEALQQMPDFQGRVHFHDSHISFFVALACIECLYSCMGSHWYFIFLISDRCSEGNRMHRCWPCCSNKRPCRMWNEFWGGVDMHGVFVWEPTRWPGTRRSGGINVIFCFSAEEYFWTFAYS